MPESVRAMNVTGGVNGPCPTATPRTFTPRGSAVNSIPEGVMAASRSALAIACIASAGLLKIFSAIVTPALSKYPSLMPRISGTVCQARLYPMRTRRSCAQAAVGSSAIRAQIVARFTVFMFPPLACVRARCSHNPKAPMLESGFRFSGFVDRNLKRCRLKTVAWILILRAIGDCHEQVHLRLEIQVVSGPRGCICDGGATFRSKADRHERRECARQLFLRYAPILHRHGQVVTAIPRPPNPIPNEVHLLAAHGIAEKIFAEGVCNNLEHRVAFVGIEYVSDRRLVRPVEANAVGIVELFSGIVAIEADHIRDLLTL